MMVSLKQEMASFGFGLGSSRFTSSVVLTGKRKIIMLLEHMGS